ncbi:STAS domain-containing protein [Herbidospora daliensis]|uniref:STAS domain-containing protein n=1 Tax=Herbidospora daliensis TaxID=295585 RepID=UPI0007810FC8|nr:STAS domain-containing protein [Herbidospora daliensis]
MAELSVSQFLIVGQIVILRIGGELAVDNCAAVQRGLARALAVHDPPRLVVDLSELSSSDSYGLAALMGADRHARETNGQMLVAGATDVFRVELRRRGLDEMLTLRRTVSEAIVELRMAFPDS